MALIFDDLDRDWQRLCSDRRAAQRMATICELADVGSIAELAELILRPTKADVDAVLLALVRRAVNGEGLAGRVLLQLLMPGIRRLARRWWALGDIDERAAAAVSAVWQRIRCYPLDQRPGRVAANILMDAAADLRHSVRGLDRVALHGAWIESEPRAVTELPASDELAEVLVDATAAGIISGDDASLIAQTRIAGRPLRDIAKSQGAVLRTLQHRRHTAELSLAGKAALVS